jgi:broad specificity phosphatase PhoE
MSDVWFIRHGESMSNAGEVAIDRGSTVLTEKGAEQARNVSFKVTARPDLIVVTPYVRTTLTAKPLLERYPDVPRETWDLHEFSALSEENYLNKTWQDRRPAMRALWELNDPEYVDGAGAESFSGMVGRINTALTRLQARPEKFIVVFAHGYIIQTTRLLLSQPELSLKSLMRSVPYYMNHRPIDNCDVIRLTRGPDGFSVHEEDFKVLDIEQAFAGD